MRRAAAVAVHLLATAGHGVTHTTVPVPVLPWQGAYAAVVLFGVPVAGCALVAGGRVRTGGLVLVAGGVGALAFEGLLHFVVANPDHVGAVGASSRAFVSTAWLTTAGDAAPLAAGLYCLGRERPQSRTATGSPVR